MSVDLCPHVVVGQLLPIVIISFAFYARKDLLPISLTSSDFHVEQYRGRNFQSHFLIL